MGKRTGSGKRTGRKVLKVAVLIFIVWIAAGVIQNRDTVWPFLLESIGADAGLHSIPATEEWELIVVNRWNEIPDGYSVSLTELSNGQKVDNRIYPYLQEMFDAARMDGIYPVVREGYRTAEEQQKILDDKIQAYMREGYSRSRAERTAKEWVAQPGTSEHQLGIAVDINADKSRSTNDDVYAWLAENAHNYGFILRYPQGKDTVTGTSYEPWHFRYVGVYNAKEIYERQICLEEFLRNE